jgi:hypothetical protein
MASLRSVVWKMIRAKQHYEELARELDAYYATRPGGLVEVPDNVAEKRHYQFQETKRLPPRIGLICGDCLQNMRSALDYLIWELVLANEKAPTEKNMFPICLKKKSYENAVENLNRLDGVNEKAIAHIDALQPFQMENPEGSPLYVLDVLTNINKHRRVLLTNLTAIRAVDRRLFPFMPVTIVARDDATGAVIRQTPMSVFVAVQDGPGKGLEITLTLNAIAGFIGDMVLPLFRDFLK